jgi:hypothetical protein
MSEPSKIPALIALGAIGVGGYILWLKMQPEPEPPYVPEIWTGAASNPVSESGWQSHHVATPKLTPSTWTPPETVKPAQSIKPLPSTIFGIDRERVLETVGFLKKNKGARVPNFWNDRASVI